MESFRYTSLKCSDSTSATINADVEHQEATAPQSATNVMPCESAIIATEQQPAFPNNQTTILSPDLNSIFDITNSTIFKQMEEKITKQIDSMKELLKRKRLELGRLKEKKFEGGKGECLRIQAKAKTFLTTKADEQQKRIQENKHEFVQQILPLIDVFKQARVAAPPSNEREENMHSAYEVLFKNLLSILKSYGYNVEELESESNSTSVNEIET